MLSIIETDIPSPNNGIEFLASILIWQTINFDENKEIKSTVVSMTEDELTPLT